MNLDVEHSVNAKIYMFRQLGHHLAAS